MLHTRWLCLSRRACIFIAHGPSQLYGVAVSRFHTQIPSQNGDDQKLGLLAMREQSNLRPNEPRQRDRRGPHTICCIRPQGDTTSFDLFRHIIKQQTHWAAISHKHLSGMKSDLYYARFLSREDLLEAHARIVVEYPSLGAFVRATLAIYNNSLRLVPISRTGYLFTEDTSRTMLRHDQLQRLKRNWVRVCGPLESLPGFDSEVPEKYGWRLKFKNVASASKAMFRLDGRESGILPWYAVDYALDPGMFKGELPPTTSIHILGRTGLRLDRVAAPLKALISSLPGFEQIQISPSPFDPRRFDAYVKFESIENASTAVSLLTSTPPQLEPPEGMSFIEVRFRNDVQWENGKIVWKRHQ